MTRLELLVVMVLAATAVAAGADLRADPEVGAIVRNGGFESGGHSYADHWRPLPGGLRMHRVRNQAGEHSLYLELREDGDGGVQQIVELPAHRRLSLRLLATCWTTDDSLLIAGLVRSADGVVLTEAVVDGIERGEVAASFETGPGGPAELLVRLVGAKGDRALLDHVRIGPPLPPQEARGPDFTGTDLVLAPGDGLRVDADFDPGLLQQAAEMLREALEDTTGSATARVAAAVSVSVARPETTQWPARESYHLTVSGDGVTITAAAEQGAFWGMMTLIDLIRAEPGGGARILAADVEDGPALPWRMGSHHALEELPHSQNAARSLARLKLNMAFVSHDWSDAPERDAAAVAALREVGLEPIIGITADSPVLPEAAMADSRSRLGTRIFAVEPWWDRDPVRGRLDWGEPGLRAALDASRASTVIVPAFTYLGHLSNGGGRYEALPTDEVKRWPREVVACLLPATHSEAAAAEVAAAEARGLRYVVLADRELQGAEAAVRARERYANCLGVAIMQWHEGQTRAADLAWRGTSAGA